MGVHGKSRRHERGISWGLRILLLLAAQLEQATKPEMQISSFSSRLGERGGRVASCAVVGRSRYRRRSSVWIGAETCHMATGDNKYLVRIDWS